MDPQATTAQITNGAPPAGYGYFWWLGQGGPYQASGIFGQSIAVVPDERLVIVVNSAWPSATGRDLFAARSAFTTPFARRRRAYRPRSMRTDVAFRR